MRRYLAEPSTVLWLVVVVVLVGLWAIFVPDVGSLRLRDELLAEITNATERKESSVDISGIIERAIDDHPDRSAAETLTLLGFKERAVRRVARHLLIKHDADRYRVFELVIKPVTMLSYWEARVIVLYRDEVWEDILGRMYFTGL